MPKCNEYYTFNYCPYCGIKAPNKICINCGIIPICTKTAEHK